MPPERASATPLTTEEADLAKDSILGDRFMIRFSEDTLKHRPLSIRLIVEFAGTFILVTVAAGSGVINHYVGGGPISRTAAVIAPGAVVMAMIYALGPLSGLHINPAVTLAFTARRVFKAIWAVGVHRRAVRRCHPAAGALLEVHVRPRGRWRELPHQQARRGSGSRS